MTDVISFPGLGLQFEVSRVAFSIGSIDIYWYAIIIATGFMLALAFAFKNFPKFGIDPDRAIDVVFFAMIFGIIGARLYYVAFQWDMYKDNLMEILNIRGGGLGFYGGIIGGIIGLIIGCKLRGQNILAFLDVAGGAVLIGQGIGRWGNFVNSEAFGSNTNLPWGMTSPKIAAYIERHSEEVMGAVMDPNVPVHPTFFYESLWCAIGLLVFCYVMKKRKFDGQMLLFYLGWNGFGRMIIEGLRTDSLMIGPFRISQLLGALMFIFAVCAFGVAIKFLKSELRPEWLGIFSETEKGKLVAAGKWDYKNNCEKTSAEKEEMGENEDGNDN
ncbi:MAG: prolipoprotein diacylglyceryl transferase [Oscillospiraceae bacterium]|nr:prolipoprotein diacylglyceryl transferase [Oscillospiraceae bacterium]MBP1574458.1 prolipoprotein diacylglyceryl transferase [Oscillospiraceae bacterium]MBQ8595094.1 prolipoprotein diacylglyceryl transferase [Oscillospiraceae bacterium]